MSDRISISKNDLDSDETSSWEVISDENSSSSSSIENIAIDEFDSKEEPPKKSDLEHIFVNISEEIANNIEKVDCSEEKTGTFTKPDWKNLKSKAKKKLKAAENFTTLSIVASIFTITGLTLLCCLFPSETDKVSVEAIKNDYFEVVKGNSKQVRDIFNKTTDILNTINNSTNYRNGTNTTNDNCPIEESFKEEILNFEYFTEKSNSEPSTSSGIYEKYHLKDLQNTTSNLIDNLRDACLSPSVHIFLCSIMQDVCLIKLIQHLKRKQVLLKNLKPKCYKNKTKIEKKRKVDNKKKKLEQQKVAKLVNKTKIETTNNIFDNLRPENGKSECERRFEELETKWQYVGKNHRQKMHEIKEEFKTEIFQMKGREKEVSMRKQKIKTIRDKYVQKLKADRERYLLQLKKIKDERQKVMHEICRRKKVETQPKEASVSNYAKIEESDNRKFQFEEYSNFWKNFSTPKIQKEKEVDANYMHDFVSNLINLTASFDNETKIDNVRDRSEISLPSTKTRKTFKKSQYNSFLPTVTRTPSKVTNKSAKREYEEKISKFDIVPFSPQSKSYNFTTTALQSPSAVRFTRKKNDFDTTFSKMIVPKVIKNEDSFSIKTDDEELKSSKSEMAPFKRGFNESYSFVPVPSPIKSKNLTKFEIENEATEQKTITLSNILKNSKNARQELNFTKENNIQDADVSTRSSRADFKLKNDYERKQKERPDLYQLLFDDDGEKVKKKEEELRENPHKRIASPPPFQMISKQDPKLPKKVYLFKGRL